LRNLKSSYLNQDDPERALRTIELLLAVTPWDLDEIRDRGLILYALGRPAEARDDLQAFVDHAPEGQARDSALAALRRMASA